MYICLSMNVCFAYGYVVQPPASHLLRHPTPRGGVRLQIRVLKTKWCMACFRGESKFLQGPQVGDNKMSRYLCKERNPIRLLTYGVDYVNDVEFIYFLPKFCPNWEKSREEEEDTREWRNRIVRITTDRPTLGDSIDSKFHIVCDPIYFISLSIHMANQSNLRYVMDVCMYILMCNLKKLDFVLGSMEALRGCIRAQTNDKVMHHSLIWRPSSFSVRSIYIWRNRVKFTFKTVSHAYSDAFRYFF